jgi:DNA-binding Xre family transcriptional regulator
VEPKSGPEPADVRADAGVEEEPKCCWCHGTGAEPKIPDVTAISQSAMSKGTGVSPSLVSLINSGKRKNPTLDTMRKFQRFLHAETGQRLPLDIIAAIFDGA